MMLFILILKLYTIKTLKYIFILIAFLAVSCSGSKKYFKAAEKLEKQGLVSEAAQYYYESLERKRNNTDARLKLKDVGQKHINNLSSEFFRQYNTQQYEQSIETFDEIKSFTSKSRNLSVDLNYPSAYQDDYAKSLEYYLSKNYNEASNNVNLSKFDLALKNISKIKKYDSNYKNTSELEVISNCEPLYIIAVRSLESKNYKSAQNELSKINTISSSYKDSKELLELTNELLKQTFLIFQPKNSAEKEIEDKLYNSFIELSYQNNGKVKLLNNTPFLYMPNSGDPSNAGNIDLIQAIKKATGADFFYVFDVANKKEVDAPLTRGSAYCFEKIVTKKDTVFITEYRQQLYNQVKGKRTYSYDLIYKVIDANTNQVITSQTRDCSGIDQIDYYEFAGKNIYGANKFNINNYFPYNPSVTLPINQYNPSTWRGGFSNRKDLKPFSDLKSLADNNALNVFSSTLNNYILK